MNNRRKIFARWNDKTVVLFDNFAVAINEGRTLQDHTFELYDIDSCGIVFKQRYADVWLIVDNGYLNWPTTVPPSKTSCSRVNVRFSQWLESIRKAVECTFGILKERFRILKTGIRSMRQESADKIFLTCCALHYWLFNEDRHDKDWEAGDQSNWEGHLGLHDVQDVEHYVPDAVRRLMSPQLLRSYDLSGMGYGSNECDQEEHPIPRRRQRPHPVSERGRPNSASAPVAERGTGTEVQQELYRK